MKVQARLESALEAPAEVAPAKRASVDRETVWDRMDAHGVSQNEVARRAGVCSGYLSQIMAGKATPSPAVLQRLHGVLYRRLPREGLHVCGSAGGGVARGRAARRGWCAEVEYAYRKGYDGRGLVAVGVADSAA